MELVGHDAAAEEAWSGKVAALQSALRRGERRTPKIQILTKLGLVAALAARVEKMEATHDLLAEELADAENAGLTRRQRQTTTHALQEKLQRAADGTAELLDLLGEDKAQARHVSFLAMARRRDADGGEQDQAPEEGRPATTTMLRTVVTQLQRLFTALERMHYMQEPTAVPAGVHRFLGRRLRDTFEAVMGAEDRHGPYAVGMAMLSRWPKAMGLPPIPHLVGGAGEHLLTRPLWERNRAAVTWLAEEVLPEALRQLQAAEQHGVGSVANREEQAARWVAEGATPAQQSGRLTHLFNTQPGVAFAVGRNARAGEQVDGRPMLDLSEMLGGGMPCPLEPQQVHAMLAIAGPPLVDEWTRREVIERVLDPVFPAPDATREEVEARLAGTLGAAEREAVARTYLATAALQSREQADAAVMRALLGTPAATLNKARGDGISTRTLVRVATTIARLREAEGVQEHAGADAAEGAVPAAAGGAPPPPAAAEEEEPQEEAAGEAAAAIQAGDGAPPLQAAVAMAEGEVLVPAAAEVAAPQQAAAAEPEAEAEPAWDVVVGDALDGNGEEDGEGAGLGIEGWGGVGAEGGGESSEEEEELPDAPPPPGLAEEEVEEGAGLDMRDANGKRRQRVKPLHWEVPRVRAAYQAVVALTQAAVNGLAFPRKHQRARITLIPKQRGMTQEKSRQPGSWRPLALLPAMQHVYAATALDALQSVEAMPWTGAGARSAHNYAALGTDAHDMIHLLATHAETALLTGQRELWLVGNDLSNAFGTVSRDFAQRVLQRLGVPPRLRGLVRRMYAHMSLHARTAKGAAAPVRMLTGFVQGCKLSPWLFSVAMEPMLRWLGRQDALGGPAARLHVPMLAEGVLTVGTYLDDVAYLAPTAAGTRRGLAVVDGIAGLMGMRRNGAKSRLKVVRQNRRHGRGQRGWQAVEPAAVLDELGLEEGAVTVVQPREALPLLGVRFNLDPEARAEAGMVGRPWRLWREDLEAAERQVQLLDLRLPHALAYFAWQVLARLWWEVPHRALTAAQGEEVEDVLVRVARRAMRMRRSNTSRDALLRPLRLGGVGVADFGPRAAALLARMRMTAPSGAVPGSSHDEAARARTAAATLPLLRARAEYAGVVTLSAAAVPQEPVLAPQALATQWRYYAGLHLVVSDGRREARLDRPGVAGRRDGSLPSALLVPQEVAHTARHGIALLLTRAVREAEEEKEEGVAAAEPAAGDGEAGGSVSPSIAASSVHGAPAASSSGGGGSSAAGAGSRSRSGSSRYELRSSRSSSSSGGGSGVGSEGAGSASVVVVDPPPPVAAPPPPAWWQRSDLALRGTVLPGRISYLSDAVAPLADEDGEEEGAAGLDGALFMTRRSLHRAAVERAAQGRLRALMERPSAGSMTRRVQDDVDGALSTEVFRSGRVASAVARLAYKLRVNELETPAWTRRIRRGDVDEEDEEDVLCDCGGLVEVGDDADEAWLQGARRLTQWHIFSFCKHSAEDIIQRHDDVVEVIQRELERRPEVRLGVVKVHAPEELYRADPAASVWTDIVGEAWPERPDLVVEHVEERRLVLVEVTVPYDTALGRRYEEKHEKYAPLVEKLEERVAFAALAVVAIGVAGYVHRRAAPELAEQLAGVIALTLADARALMRQASVVAVRGSHHLWRERGRRYRALAQEEADGQAPDGGESVGDDEETSEEDEDDEEEDGGGSGADEDD